ncbi:DNA/RNA non-specific endonuclease [Auraticoccus monumenti]|uniref:Endonuclease G n=1 Tax=Auraticoccus monumenti TaxID=675864 RepID=A0A1G6W5L6_9ACTN|nr:DNA/RNA non-specific endonuclease [Auraticoccus monumenti]SDD60335.1 endonuclease G [Auraticoccus monumenti]
MTGPPGFDEAFLDVPVPVPTSASPLTRLDYVHFSVGLDRERRLAAWTAVTIDGAALVDVPRSNGWFLDPRLPAEQQVGPEVYAGNDLDRGHLVRRQDPVWGEAADRAEADTFAYPNAAPQASGFNQSKELWLGLEDYVLGTADAADVRLSVVTGCVFDDADPVCRWVALPLRFYKVAAWCVAGVLRSSGYVLDQTPLLDDVGRTQPGEPLLGPYRTFQVPVADVAGLTGLELGPLPDADVAAASGLAPGSAWRELASPRDLLW